MSNRKEDRALKKAVRELPVLSPDEGLWDAIEQALEEDTEGLKQPKRFRWLPLAAASVVLCLTTYFILLNNTPDTEITYSEEAFSAVFAAEQDFAGISNQFETFLKDECESREEICDDEEFNLLVEQLEEVSAEKDALMEMIRSAGNSLRIEKAWNVLEKEDARLKKEIVKLLRT